MKVKDIMREANTTYKVIKTDPNTGIELQRPEDPHTTLHLDPEAAKAIAANPDNPNQFTMNPAIAGSPNATQGPQQGSEIEMPATENQGDIGGDPTDDYINGVVDHDFERAAKEGMFGFGNKSPEEWAKTSQQMAQLLKLQKAYQGTQFQSQIEKRIELLKNRLDNDEGEVGGPGGIPKPVVPPEKFDTKQFNEVGEIPAQASPQPDAPAADVSPQLSPEDQEKLEPYKNIDPADGSAYYDYPPTDPKEIGARMGTVMKTPDAIAMSKQTQPKIIADLLDMIDNPAIMPTARTSSEPVEMPDLEENGSNARSLRPTGNATVRSVPAPVQESADDKLLQKMLTIAGLR